MTLGILNETEAVFRVMSDTSVISEIKHTGIITIIQLSRLLTWDFKFRTTVAQAEHYVGNIGLW